MLTFPYPPDLTRCSYCLVVVDSANHTANGAPMGAYLVSAFGNGSVFDGAGTDSELASEVVYVADMDNSTSSFTQGFQSGITPTNGTGVALWQLLPDLSFLWSLDTASEWTSQNGRMRHDLFRVVCGVVECSPLAAVINTPKSLQLRYFVSLDYQPVVIEMKPEPPFPKAPAVTEYESSYSGSKFIGAEEFCRQ